MNRRTFITVLGCTAAWPLVVQAQQGTVPAVGFLSNLVRNDRPNLIEAFRRGLGEAGYVEGRNVTFDYQFSENQPDRLPALAEDLVSRRVAVIAATGRGRAVLAAKAATSTIPVVFTYGGDPLREGFVSSLNRPGGNITGVTFYATLGAKMLGLMHEVLPNAGVVAVFAEPREPGSDQLVMDTQAAARTLGLRVTVIEAGTPSDIDRAFMTLRQRADAIVVGGSPFFTGRRQQIVALAARDRIPAIYSNREFVPEGGLMSYGYDADDLYRRAGAYCGRILKGERAGDLPIDQATRSEFVMNLKTAKALGLEIPSGILASADEVIE
jgi:putative ABC transport system substrate-binding protein